MCEWLHAMNLLLDGMSMSMSNINMGVIVIEVVLTRFVSRFDTYIEVSRIDTYIESSITYRHIY